MMFGYSNVFVTWLCYVYPTTFSSLLPGIINFFYFTYDKMLVLGKFDVGSQLSSFGLNLNQRASYNGSHYSS